MRQWQQTTFTLLALGMSISLFLSMILMLEVGRRLGIRAVRRHGSLASAGIGVVESAVYSLLALLMGFSFSGAASRFEHRKQLVVREVSTLSTAWQRIVMFPPGPRDTVQTLVRGYVDALLVVYGSSSASPEENRARADVSRFEHDIWLESVDACMPRSDKPICVLLLPSLNEVFDVVDEERLARNIHLPRVVLVMLFAAALATALFAGQAMSAAPARNWILILGIAGTVSLTTYVILELEYPRAGLIRVNGIDEALAQFRQTMR